MGIFDIFKKRATTEEIESGSIELSSGLLQAFLQDDYVSRKMAMNVPTFAGCINAISNLTCQVPIYLYKKHPDGSSERVDDTRADLLNRDTKDTLTGTDLKRAIVRDFYLNKGGYIYINRVRTKVKSLHYVDPDLITFQYSEDPIFKDYKIFCNGKGYDPYCFVKVLRNTQNGWRGKSIIAENAEVLSTAYNALKFENRLVKRGGNKKGFLQAAHKLSQDLIDYLKDAFRNLYSNDSENVVVLNDGVTFNESSETSVEMQLNENKKSNAVETCKLFNIPPAIINGGATKEERLAFIQDCVMSFLEIFCTALDRDLLLESEKSRYFFAPDTYELTKADVKTRYEAYKTAYTTGFMQLDDIRKQENMPTLGLNYIKLGLQDVLFNPDTGLIFTPNMGLKANINDVLNGSGTIETPTPTDAQVSGEVTDPKESDQTGTAGKETDNENNDQS